MISAEAGRLGPFGDRVFRAMWASTIASQLGGFIQIVATGWAMVAIGSSAAMVALVQTAASLPVMLFAIGAGALADLFGRRAIMLVAQLMMLSLSAILTILAATGRLGPEILLLFTFLIGCGMALHMPAWQASVGELVPARLISSAVAANIVGNNVARSIGPAIGGLIVTSLGIAGAFLINTISYLGILFVLWRWQAPPIAHAAPVRLRQSIAEGIGFAFHRRPLRRLLARALLFSFGSAAAWGLMPAIAVNRGGDATLLGLLFACFGAGAMGGAIWGEVLRRRLGSELVARLGSAAMVVALGLLGMADSVPLTIFSHVLAGAGWVAALSSFNISIQLGVRRSMVGRQLAIYQTTTFGALALGSAVWGVMTDEMGLAPALMSAAVFLAVGAIAGARLGLPRSLAQEHAY